VLKTPNQKNWQIGKFAIHKHVPRTWTDALVQPKQWKRDMRFGTWNLRSLYRAGSPTTEAREFARYKLDLVGVTGG